MMIARLFTPVRSMLRVSGAIALAVTLVGGCGDRGMDQAEAGEAEDVTTPLVPRVTIVEPADGTELDGASVRVVLAIENLELAPAGDQRPGTGHHHLFLNAPIPDAGEVIVATGIVHLGQAQTSHEFTNLAPGEYTLISVVGDLVHRRIDPQILDTVRFRVRAP